jgi:ubiquinone/menaquinone biosynthesis C-methylase UbiE
MSSSSNEGDLCVNRFHNWYCRSSLWRRTIQGSILPWVLSDTPLGDELLEIGPGPGLTTDILRKRVPKLTAIEYDPGLADRLRVRLRGSNVTVVTGDATEMPFESGRFSAVASFTMLHHVPSPAAQDAVLREAFRVLRPGGKFLGSDSRSSLVFRAAHLFDKIGRAHV